MLVLQRVSWIAVFGIDVTTFVTRASCVAVAGTSTASVSEKSVRQILLKISLFRALGRRFATGTSVARDHL
jgi:hypothetical protein